MRLTNADAAAGLATARGYDSTSATASGLLAPFASLLARWSKAAADRRLRDQLAEMSPQMLLDIGIREEEIHLVRGRVAFTPREWADRAMTVRRFG